MDYEYGGYNSGYSVGHALGFLLLAVVIVSSAWVLIDSLRLQAQGCFGRSAFCGPIGLTAACLLLWIVAFPFYILWVRPHYLALDFDKRRKGRIKDRLRAEKHKDSNAEQRFNCPECGESIPVAAKLCRFCHALLTIKDRPAKKKSWKS